METLPLVPAISLAARLVDTIAADARDRGAPERAQLLLDAALEALRLLTHPILSPAPSPSSGPSALSAGFPSSGTGPATPADASPERYEIPGPPPVDREVTDGVRLWRRLNSGAFQLVALDGRPDELEQQTIAWPHLLLTRGPIWLVPLTAAQEHDAALYGPPGARWGQIGTPCPYGPCSLWVGHTGPHTDSTGAPLGQTAPSDEPADVGVTRVDLETICTCGHPSAHQEHCARYARMTGTDDAPTPYRCAVLNGWGHVVLFADVIRGDGSLWISSDRAPTFSVPLGSEDPDRIAAHLVSYLPEYIRGHALDVPRFVPYPRTGTTHPQPGHPVHYRYTPAAGNPFDLCVEPTGTGQYRVKYGVTEFITYELATAFESVNDNIPAAYPTAVEATP